MEENQQNELPLFPSKRGPGGDERAGGEAELSIDQKKEYAKYLFVRKKLSQKEIANEVGVSEQAMVRWVREGKWEEMRKTLLSTKQEQLALMYQMLELLNKEAIQALSDDDPATKPNADAIRKITKSIHELENQTGIGEMIDTAQALIDFVRHEDIEAAKVINTWFDLFIKDRLNALER